MSGAEEPWEPAPPQPPPWTFSLPDEIGKGREACFTDHLVFDFERREVSVSESPESDRPRSDGSSPGVVLVSVRSRRRGSDVRDALSARTALLESWRRRALQGSPERIWQIIDNIDELLSEIPTLVSASEFVGWAVDNDGLRLLATRASRLGLSFFDSIHFVVSGDETDRGEALIELVVAYLDRLSFVCSVRRVMGAEIEVLDLLGELSFLLDVEFDEDAPPGDVEVVVEGLFLEPNEDEGPGWFRWRLTRGPR